MPCYRVRKRCGQHCDGVLCVGTESRIIQNTTDETSQFPEMHCGYLTFPAGFFKAGTCLHVDLRGFISYTGTPQATQRIKLGGVTIVENVGTFGTPNITEAQTLFDFKLVCRSAGAEGAFIGGGRTSLLAGPGLISATQRALKMLAPVSIDTCQPLAFDVTYQWGTADAGNRLEITYATITYMEIG